MKYFFLISILTIAFIQSEAQVRPINGSVDSMAISDISFHIISGFRNDATATSTGILMRKNTITPFFCRLENKINKRSGTPVFFRLGNKDYTDMLERKDINKAIFGSLQ